MRLRDNLVVVALCMAGFNAWADAGQEVGDAFHQIFRGTAIKDPREQQEKPANAQNYVAILETHHSNGTPRDKLLILYVDSKSLGVKPSCVISNLYQKYISDEGAFTEINCTKMYEMAGKNPRYFMVRDVEMTAVTWSFYGLAARSMVVTERGK